MRRLLPVLLLVLLAGAGTLSAAVPRTFTHMKAGILGGDLRDFSFPTSLTGYAVGDDILAAGNNFIAKTTDGGWTWTDITPEELLDQPWGVTFVTEATGYVSAYSGILLKTTDGGVSWNNVNASGYAGNLYDVRFWNADTGWACGTNSGGTILRTTDGGATWALLNPGTTNTRYNILTYSGTEALFSGSSGNILRTTDCGTTWTTAAAGSNTMYTLKATRGDTLFSTGSQQVVYRSTDRGVSWTLAWDRGVLALYGMDVAPDSSTAFMVGSNGVNYRTTNGWATFDSVQVTSLTSDVCRAVVMLSAQDIIVGSDEGTIHRSSDGGATWHVVEASTKWYALDFLDEDNGVAVGWRGACMRTTDGGVTWTRIKGMQGGELYDVQMLSPTTFMACGSAGSFYLTTDGGLSFVRRAIPSTVGSAKTVQFFNSSEGYVGGEAGTLYYTTDAGVSWTPQFSFGASNNDIEDVVFVTDSIGFIAGDAGKFAATTDRAVWDSTGRTLPMSTASTSWELAFTDANRGFATSMSGRIFATTTGGTSWTLASDTTGLLNVDVIDIAVLHPDTLGYAAAEQGKFMVLSTGGIFQVDTTILTVRGVPDNLWGIDFVSPTRAFISGYYGTIYRLDLQIQQGPVTLPVSYAAGWNLLSNPVVTTADSVQQLYPGSLFPYGFAFSGAAGYVQEQQMTNGRGYWVKTAAPGLASITGLPLAADSVPVTTGWNMIGSVSAGVDTSTITSSPPGIRSSQFFGYNGGYTPAATLDPGRGYWVKASAPGVLLVTVPAPGVQRRRAAAAPDDWTRLSIRDAAGRVQHLYLATDPGVAGAFELPPPPPEGALDVRFRSGQMVELLADDAAYPVDVRGAVEPLTVEWNVRGARRLYLSAGGPPVELSGSGALRLSGDAARGLAVLTGTGDVPVEFALDQNHPNPFNPVTRISFRVPAAGRVRLEVFDLLGRRVVVLVDEERAAGAYAVEMNAAQLSSGTYVYRLTAGGASASGKMMLLK